VLTTDIAVLMPPPDPNDPNRDIQVTVSILENWLGISSSSSSQLYLSRRRGTYAKPVFQNREWEPFIQSQGGREGDLVYFRYEEDKRAFHIVVEHANLFPAHPGDL
jgi:hypothetical protein